MLINAHSERHEWVRDIDKVPILGDHFFGLLAGITAVPLLIISWNLFPIPEDIFILMNSSLMIIWNYYLWKKHDIQIFLLIFPTWISALLVVIGFSIYLAYKFLTAQGHG